MYISHLDFADWFLIICTTILVGTLVFSGLIALTKVDNNQAIIFIILGSYASIFIFTLAIAIAPFNDDCNTLKKAHVISSCDELAQKMRQKERDRQADQEQKRKEEEAKNVYFLRNQYGL